MLNEISNRYYILRKLPRESNYIVLCSFNKERECYDYFDKLVNKWYWYDFKIVKGIIEYKGFYDKKKTEVGNPHPLLM